VQGSPQVVEVSQLRTWLSKVLLESRHCRGDDTQQQEPLKRLLASPVARPNPSFHPQCCHLLYPLFWCLTVISAIHGQHGSRAKSRDVTIQPTKMHMVIDDLAYPNIPIFIPGIIPMCFPSNTINTVECARENTNLDPNLLGLLMHSAYLGSVSNF